VALLSISDAARVAGVARSTLHRAIKAGRLSLAPDGRVDTAELLRAGYTLQGVTQQQRPVALQGATETQQGATGGAQQRAQQPAPPVPPQALEAMVRERDQLAQQLRTTQERLQEVERATAERERYYQGQVVWLQLQIDQTHELYARLLPTTTATGTAGATSAAAMEPRGDMRQRIITLLRDYPEGLSPAQTRQYIGVAKDLGNTMKGMMRDGLLRRVELGRYAATDEEFTNEQA